MHLDWSQLTVKLLQTWHLTGKLGILCNQWIPSNLESEMFLHASKSKHIIYRQKWSDVTQKYGTSRRRQWKRRNPNVGELRWFENDQLNKIQAPYFISTRLFFASGSAAIFFHRQGKPQGTQDPHIKGGGRRGGRRGGGRGTLCVSRQ